MYLIKHEDIVKKYKTEASDYICRNIIGKM